MNNFIKIKIWRLLITGTLFIMVAVYSMATGLFSMGAIKTFAIIGTAQLIIFYGIIIYQNISKKKISSQPKY